MKHNDASSTTDHAARERRSRRRAMGAVIALVILRLGLAVVVDDQGHLRPAHDIMISGLFYYAWVVGPLLFVLIPLAFIGMIVWLMLMPRSRDQPPPNDQDQDQV